VEPAVRYNRQNQKWILIEVYSIEIDGLILLPALGFEFRASVPEWLWSVVDPEELSMTAALAHDWIYAHGGRLSELPDMEITRYTADKMFLKLMKDANVFCLTRWLAFWAVRLFGSKQWRSA
jgi:hypothetical protein